MQKVSKIVCVDNAGFVMNFYAEWNGGRSNRTANYPINQSGEVDLTELSIPKGGEVWPVVKAILGKTNSSAEHVIYDPSSSNTATYTVKGTTLHYSVTLQ